MARPPSTGAAAAVSSDEASPLLGSDVSSKQQPQVIRIESVSPKHKRVSSRWSPTALLALMMLAIAVLNFGESMTSTPFTRVYEGIACYQYWEVHDPSKLSLDRAHVGPGAVGGIDESLCKIPPVQSEVATLRGWQLSFDNIPGWFWQTLPLRLIWLSALHALVSGGGTVIAAIALTVVSDVTDATTRTTALLRVYSSSMITYFIGPPFGAFLMSKFNPWAALFVALIAYTIPVVCCCFIPETLNYYHPSLDHQPLHPRLDEDPTDLLVPREETTADQVPPSSTYKQAVSRLRSSAMASTSFLAADKRIPLLVLPMLAMMMSEAARELLVQYASVRYSVPMARATYFVSFSALTKVGALLFVVPAATMLLSRWCRSLSPMRRDLLLARITALVAGVGWMLAGVSLTLAQFVASLILSTIGAGAPALSRSCLTGLVGKHNIGKLYTAISVIEALTLIACGPLISSLWSAGMRLGGFALGLPFYAIASFYFITTIALLLVRFRKGEGEVVLGDSEDEDNERAPLMRESAA
ncbi:hypothetical protein ANO11243_004530 [Dothideomycetidae sp. 11243]|nr:hypothetical protein ANO11243_004530 [fungal sp. No.11243]